MRNSIFSLVVMVFVLTQLSAQDRGVWVDYDLSKEYTPDFLQAVGGNVLIYYPAVNADTVLAYSTYSHQWYEHAFHLSESSANAYAGENVALVWNDSILILFDAIHSTFHDLEFAGTMIHTGSAPYNLPGSIGKLSYIITTEKIYIFDQDSEEWFVYAYTHPGAGGSFGYAGYGKKDYIMISISNYQTSETKNIAFSQSRKVFEEISSINLAFNVLEHGFACWVNSNDQDAMFTMYSAANGFMETVKPNHYFDTFINWNDPVAESTVFMAAYYIPHESAPGGTRYVYAADTRHGAFSYYHFEDSYGGEGETLGTMNTGFGAGIITKESIPSNEISANFFNGEINNFVSAGNSVLRANTAENGYFAGSSYFTGYDTYHFIFNNMAAAHQHTIELPTPTEGYTNPTAFRMNADWGIATCQRALTNTISIYSFNTNTDSVQTIEEPFYSYDFDKLKRKYYYYGSQAYNDAKKILVYEPVSDVWVTLPLASDGQWFFGSDFICTYDKNDGNLKIHDVPENHELAFSLGWQSTYDFNKHTYGQERFYIASNTDGHYFGFSAYTREIKEFVADYYYSTVGKGMVAVMYHSFYGRDLLAFNALSNSFIPLELSDEQGDSRNIWIGDSTALVTTQHGHLLAFDPYLYATAIEDRESGGGALAQQFQLAQNYPNPFNPSTAISYQLSTVSNVQLTVYNSLGQKVRTLVNERQKAGHHSVNFDARGLGSGVYYYRLRTGQGFTQTKKMILMR